MSGTLAGALRKRRDEARALWPRFGLLPLLVFVGWPAFRVAVGDRRWDLLALVAFGGVLPYIGPRSKRFFLGTLPLGLVGVVYDALRLVKGVGLSPERVHLCDLRDAELDWFGVDTASGPVTVHDVLQAHATLPLDVLSAIPYGTFLVVAAAFAIYLYFRDYPAMQRFTWAFFALNVGGFVMHHAFPAAPPWYYHAHGCLVDLSTRGNEGPNLARVDAFLGVPYFHGFYARSNDVFGALPSLHVAYPLLIALEGWTAFGLVRPPKVKWMLRSASIVFVAWMAFAAVYLDHHWVIDVIAGMGYATLVFAACRLPSRRVAHDAPAPTTEVMAA